MLEKNEILQGRYRIVRPLGKGGMGAVYEAKDQRLGSSVAVKEIIIDIDQIPTAKQRSLFRRAFEREAKLLAHLQHEVFPRVIDYFFEQDRQFLIMELVEGSDLGEMLHKNRKPFPIKDCLEWAGDLLDALDYLHTQNPAIYHRDIKPQNLKITSRGLIKLLDFGIAKSFDQNASTLTNQTFVGATLNYSPIEQILPAISDTFREFIILKHEKKAKEVLKQTTNARCDLYSVGATFYHLLTNRAPLDSAKRSLEVWEGNRDPLVAPNEINVNLPQAVSDWLVRAMQIEHDQRFGSAKEMREALKTAIETAKAENYSAAQTLTMIDALDLAVEENDEEETLPRSSLKTKSDEAVKEAKSRSRSKRKNGFETQTPSADPMPEPSIPIETPSVPIAQALPFETVETDEMEDFSPEKSTGSELTGMVYFDENLLEEKKSSPKPVHSAVSKPVQTIPPKRPFQVLPAVAVAALFLFVVGGIIGIVWLRNSNPAETYRQPANTAGAIPTPDFSPAPVSTVTPLPTPTAENLPVAEVSPTLTPKPETTVAPTPETTPQPSREIKPPTEERKPKSTFAAPTRTPTPVPNKPAATPKPAKPKPVQDPNCVFTNSCQD